MKPILLGMNNPLSDDQAHALYPVPDGCTGARAHKARPVRPLPSMNGMANEEVRA